MADGRKRVVKLRHLACPPRVSLVLAQSHPRARLFGGGRLHAALSTEVHRRQAIVELYEPAMLSTGTALIALGDPEPAVALHRVRLNDRTARPAPVQRPAMPADPRARKNPIGKKSQFERGQVRRIAVAIGHPVVRLLVTHYTVVPISVERAAYVSPKKAFNVGFHRRRRLDRKRRRSRLPSTGPAAALTTAYAPIAPSPAPLPATPTEAAASEAPATATTAAASTRSAPTRSA
mmetsp:Transcript_25650/g.59829  ORF Transcript_25650/g.59829 Transcript_25650/m.59829 type:complete len:234 (+) Transcript_25650:448-1149(+)